MRCRTCTFASTSSSWMLAFAFVAAIGTAGAQDAIHAIRCMGLGSAPTTPDEKLAACNAVLSASRHGPSDLAILLAKRAEAWYLKRDYDRAIIDLDDSIKLNPASVLTYESRGNAWREKGDIPRAIADYNTALGIMPNYSTAFAERGWAHHLAGRESEALADLAKALEISPRHINALGKKARVHETLKEKDKAIAEFRKAAEINPKFQEALDGLKRLGAAQ